LTHAILRRALQQAVKWGTVPRNVCDAVDPPRVARKEIHALTAEQAKQLLKAAADDRLGAMYTLAVSTGLRLGELFGLQWADVDLAAGTGSLMVRHTLMEVNGELSLSEPKTAKSRRKVELSTMAVDALWDHRRKMLAAGYGCEGFIFRNSTGGPLRRSHFHADNFKPLLKRAGLPDIRFHDLRHTAATLMLSGGEHPKVVQEMLGHSNISMTMDTYSHVLPTMQREAVNRLGKTLSVG
jgi:integrase